MRCVCRAHQSFCVRHINRRIPVLLLGISSTSTQEVIEYGQHADRLEVDAASWYSQSLLCQIDR